MKRAIRSVLTPCSLCALILAVLVSRLHSQALPLAEAVSTLRIPGDADEYFFDRIAGIQLTGSGGILVLLPVRGVVVEFDRFGKYRRMWGRRGSGPGEFRGPTLIGRKGDSVWVFDYSLARLSLFSSQGHFLASIQLPVSGSGYVLQDGNVAAFPPLTYSVGVSAGPPIVIRRFARSGALLDTILSIPPSYRVFQYERGEQTIVGAQPFEDGPIAAGATDGSGFLIVHRESTRDMFELIRVSYSGDTIYDSRIRYSKKRLTDAVVRRSIADLLSQGLPSSEVDLSSRIDHALYRPRTLPTVTDAVIGADSSVWLRREFTYQQTSTWTIVDGTGQPKYNVDLPSSFRPFFATLHTVLGVQPDSNGVPSILQMSVRPPR